MKQHQDQTKRALIVLNPVAGTRDADDVQRQIEESLTNAGWTYEIVETKKHMEIATLTQKAAPGDYDLVVAAGGDGTIAGVVSALVGTGVPLGVVPAGTGNALARDLGIPLALDQAAALLTSPHRTQELNVLQVGEAYYLLNVSAGISAATMWDTKRSAKQKLGLVAYLLDLLQQLGRARSTKFTLTIDGDRQETRAAEVAIINRGLISPEILARFADLDLDRDSVAVMILRARSGPDYLTAILDLLLRRPRHSTRISMRVAHDYVTIKPHSPVPIQADGEPLDMDEVTVRVVPHSIRVLVPE